MRLLSIALICLTMSTAQANIWEELFGPEIESETGDHCKDQAYDFLYEVLGDVTVKKVQKDSNGNGGGKSINYWFSLEECRGYVVASTSPTNPSCSTAHYGHVPKYIVRMWAKGKCKKLLPKQVTR